MSITPAQQKILLKKAQQWFADTVIAGHKSNTAKLAKLTNFQVNPFLESYLAAFLTDEVTPASRARALVLPRALGTSINTSFGAQMQRLTTDVLGGVFGSLVNGIDIEFIDAQTKVKTYCQVKLGPNTINKDDVQTIHMDTSRRPKIWPNKIMQK